VELPPRTSCIWPPALPHFHGRVCAATISAATRRVALDGFTSPVFDMVMAPPRAIAFRADCMHFTDQTVERMVT